MSKIDELYKLKGMVETAKEYQALKSIKNYENMDKIWKILDGSENWKLIHSKTVGTDSETMEKRFAYYAANIGCCIAVIYNEEAKYVVVKDLSIAVVKEMMLEEFNELLNVAGYKELCDTAEKLKYHSPNWTLIKSSEVHGGKAEDDIDEVFEFYAPTINQGLQISLNAYASHATIRKFTETELRALELNHSQETSTSLDAYQNAGEGAPKR